MRTNFYTAGLLFSLMLLFITAPVSGQSVWDGGDNLPVNPLTCPGENTENGLDAEPVEYNGAQPTNPPDLVGQSIVVVNTPQAISPAYDRAIEQGMVRAAGELGNVEVLSSPSSVVSVSQQAALDEYMFGGVHGILFAADDQENIAPNLRAALDAGIHVIGYDSDTRNNAREWFVQPVAYNAMAKALVDNLVEQAGPETGFAILTSNFDSPQAGRWIAEMSAYAAQCYPQLEWLETVETQSDGVLAYNQASLMLGEYAGDLGGIISVTTTATPQLAEAISQNGACNRVAVVGVATPTEMRPYISNGCVQAAVLWDPAELGYAAIHVMRAAIDGALEPGATSVELGRLGAVAVMDGSNVLLGEPLIITAGNINNLDF